MGFDVERFNSLYRTGMETCVSDSSGRGILVGDRILVEYSIHGKLYRSFEGTVSFGVYGTDFGHDGCESHLGFHISDIDWRFNEDRYDVLVSLYGWCTTDGCVVTIISR